MFLPARLERLRFYRRVVPLGGHVGQVQSAEGVAESIAVLGPQLLSLDHLHIQQNIWRLLENCCTSEQMCFNLV